MRGPGLIELYNLQTSSVVYIRAEVRRLNTEIQENAQDLIWLKTVSRATAFTPAATGIGLNSFQG